jgi:ribosomal protein S18 acetylase RimI-like enzyme
LVIESVVTHLEHRQRGYGGQTIGYLLDWAKRSGAVGACLQVRADNIPARALYRALGFKTELYQYHYRRRDLPVERMG